MQYTVLQHSSIAMEAMKHIYHDICQHIVTLIVNEFKYNNKDIYQNGFG